MVRRNNKEEKRNKKETKQEAEKKNRTGKRLSYKQGIGKDLEG